MRHRLVAVVSVFLLSLGLQPLRAQFAGTSAPNNVNAAALPKPPAGSKAAIVVFEDLGCPYCAHAHPIEAAVAQKEHVPVLRYDFPVAQHVWTFQGAVCARYIQDKVNPQLADQYRSDVFKAQQRISNKDDLQDFTRVWLQKHGQQMPFVLDSDGKLTKEVQADFDLGMRVHVTSLPTIIVVTNQQYQIVCGTEAPGSNDPERLLPVVQGALAKAQAPTNSKAPARRVQQ